MSAFNYCNSWNEWAIQAAALVGKVSTAILEAESHGENDATNKILDALTHDVIEAGYQASWLNWKAKNPDSKANGDLGLESERQYTHALEVASDCLSGAVQYTFGGQAELLLTLSKLVAEQGKGCRYDSGLVAHLNAAAEILTAARAIVDAEAESPPGESVPNLSDRVKPSAVTELFPESTKPDIPAELAKIRAMLSDEPPRAGGGIQRDCLASELGNIAGMMRNADPRLSRMAERLNDLARRTRDGVYEDSGLPF